MEDLVGRVAREPEPSWYANGYGVYMRLFVALGLDGERAIFTGNRVAGALAPLALYALDRTLFGDPRKALFAALGAAALPLQIRLSASETMQLVPSLMTVVAFMAFGAHARTGRRALAAAGILAFSYAVLTRPETGLVAAALPLLYLAPGGRRAIRDRALLGGAAAAIAVGVPLARAGLLNLWAHPVAPLPALHNLIAALGAAGPPHAAWAAAALAGYALLVAGGRAAACLPPLVALAAGVEVAGFDFNFANRLQLLVAEWPWLLVGAAALPAAIARLAAHAGARVEAAAVALLAAAIVLSAAAAPLLRATWDQQDEFVFVRRSDALLASLPACTPVVRLDRGDADDGTLPSLPRHLLRPGTPLYTIGDLIAGRVPLPAVLYRGIDCVLPGAIRTGPEPPRSGPPIVLRPACRELEERYRLTPLRTARVSSPPFTGSRHAGPVEIGFYRVEAP
jgi:hypothetical protein